MSDSSVTTTPPAAESTGASIQKVPERAEDRGPTSKERDEDVRKKQQVTDLNIRRGIQIGAGVALIAAGITFICVLTSVILRAIGAAPSLKDNSEGIWLYGIAMLLLTALIAIVIWGVVSLFKEEG